jgi:hypothetical protein
MKNWGYPRKLRVPTLRKLMVDTLRKLRINQRY